MTSETPVRRDELHESVSFLRHDSDEYGPRITQPSIYLRPSYQM